jgi:carotenoid 1,2-hydratase
VSAPPELPGRSGAYRWLYADVQAGPVTVVCIFMIGALFSPRYAVAARRGAVPRAHSAVNCAVYRDGRRLAWVFTEWPGARVTADTLAIGRSTWTWTDDGVVLAVDERTAPWGGPMRARLHLRAETPAGPTLALDASRRHHWTATMPRAVATVELPELGLRAAGVGYHDGNHGDEPLGSTVPGWVWARVHAAGRTTIAYHLPAPTETILVEAEAGGVTLARTPPAAASLRRTRWGLRIPQRIGVGAAALTSRHLLESSPFYARLEERRDGMSGVAEIADFRRFHARRIRWMAYFRMRQERAA